MAWLFPSVIIEGCSEEEAKAFYSVALRGLSETIVDQLNDSDIEVRWDEGCEKIEDEEVVDNG